MPGTADRELRFSDSVPDEMSEPRRKSRGRLRWRMRTSCSTYQSAGVQFPPPQITQPGIVAAPGHKLLSMTELGVLTVLPLTHGAAGAGAVPGP